MIKRRTPQFRAPESNRVCTGTGSGLVPATGHVGQRECRQGDTFH